MSRTEVALNKLNERQKNSLETWTKLGIIALEKGNDIYKKYRFLVTGYLSALEELDAITQTDSRLLRLYFMLKVERELLEDKE